MSTYDLTDLQPTKSSQPITPVIEQTYNDLFKEVSQLNEEGIVVNNQCKFCTHPLRHEAEKRWETVNRSFVPVKKFFEKWEDENPDAVKMNGQNIHNHLVNHYSKQEQKMWLQEYAKDVQTYMNYKVSQDRRFEMLRAVMEKQLLDVGSNPSIDLVRKSDQMVKISKMLLEIDECQARLRGDLKPVNVISERFMNVWLHIINKQENAAVKNHLKEALDQFEEHMQSSTLTLE